MNYLYALFVILAGVVGSKIIIFLWRFLGLPNFRKKVYFRDSYNRIKNYRGVNVCNYSKTAPDFLPWHTKEDYVRLKNWGFNLVRFLVFWEAIEPKKGEFNLEYIEGVKKHLKILEDLDIDVIIDIHQDLYSSKFTGNGFPSWALPEKEYPFKPQSKWYMNYFQPAVIESYKHFWKENSLHAKYLNLVQFVYTNLCMPKNVIGIDVMNEPFPNFPKIWEFESNTLSKFYENINAYGEALGFIRKLFFESWILTSTGLPSYLKEKLFKGKNIHFPHFYPPFCHDQGKYNWINKMLTKIAIRSKAMEARRFCSPLIIGEIGIYPNVKNYLNFVSDFLDLSEKYHVNWAWYAYDKLKYSVQGLLDDNLKPTPTLFKLLRIYPQKIAGKNPKYYTKGKTFYFECESDTSTTGETEIYTVPQQKLKISSNVEYVMEDNILKFDCSKLEKIIIKIEY